MTYIRTKDGVYISSEAYWAGNTDEIIAEASTIEELCDEFVLDETHYIESDLKEIVLYEKCVGKGLLTTIYGAIWTSKGLIYVAKMNSKGELELI